MGENKRRRDFERLLPHQRLGDAPVDAEYHDKMVEVVRALDAIFNGDTKGESRKTGFVLMVYPFGSHDGRCNYMSNGVDRRDIVVLMKEMIARFEGQPEMVGRG